MRKSGFLIVLGVLLAVSGCAAPRVIDANAPSPPLAADQPPPPPVEQAGDGTISDAFYQPTLHGIIALQGGYGAQGQAQPLVTKWRRGRTGPEFTLRLDPNDVTVQAVEPGRYMLLAAEDGNGQFVDVGDASGAPREITVTVDPGEVVYAGSLGFRVATVKPKPAKKDAKKKKPPAPPAPDVAAGPREVMLVQVRDQSGAARTAVQARFPQKAAAMKKRLVAAK
ncbi:MAG: hypothetical protein AB7S41_10775 [Parvibaculaceae bacterium]